MKIPVVLQPKQRQALILSKKTSTEFYGGAKGGGKSHVIRARQVLRRLKYPGSKGLIIRKTYPELLSNHIRKFWTEYPVTKNWYNKSEKAIYWPNGSVTEFSYLKNTDDVYTYQGRDYDDIDIDEITQHEEDVFKILRSSNRVSNPMRSHGIQPRMFLTGNPGGIGHAWVKRIFVDRQFRDGERPDDFTFIQAFVSDNLALTQADPEYVRRLQDLPEHLRRAYLYGDWDVFAGQVFDFRGTKEGKPYHVIKPKSIPDNANRFISIDWGGNAPVSIGWYAVFPCYSQEGIRFTRIWKYRELYYGIQGELASAVDFQSREKLVFSDENVAKVIARKSEGEDIEYVTGDPAMASSKPRSVTTKGESVIEVMNKTWKDMSVPLFIKPSDNDRVNGLARVRYWLSDAPDGLPYYQVFDNCQDTVRTFPLLIYKDGEDDVDTDTEDHVYDETRYGFMSRPYEAPEEKEIKPEDTPGTFDYHLKQMKRKRIIEKQGYI